MENCTPWRKAGMGPAGWFAKCAIGVARSFSGERGRCVRFQNAIE